MKSSTKSRIETLMAQVSEANYRYYVLDQPTISDEKYDLIFKELVELESADPHLADPASPTQKVGGKALDKFSKYRHREPMLSLQNIYSPEELKDFYERWSGIIGTDFTVVG